MTAEEIRVYVLENYAPRAEKMWEDDGPWYHGTCDSTCAVLEDELELAPFTVVEWGGFKMLHGGTDGHCWLQAPDGTIVDPTSAQYGLDPCLISRPGDEHHNRYLEHE